MSNQRPIRTYKSLRNIATRLRDELNNGGNDFVLLYAYNGTGKTRLSMEFKEKGKRTRGIQRDTLYFNAFTEDLFSWDNDLNNDSERALQINSDSQFFAGFQDFEMESRIFPYLERYVDFNFEIDYENWRVIFRKEVKNPRFRPESSEPETVTQDHIKISRGEENIFIWCIYLALCELVLEDSEAYNWVKFFYIDDPISSLDDNNAIAVATDLAGLLKRGKDKQIKTIISSHHGLFFNVMCNELKKSPHKTYFIHRQSDNGGYTLQTTTDTPFFHHVAILSELKKASDTGKLYTYHFNALRSVLEKTAAFLGQDDFSYCLDNTNEVLYSRAVNIFSHGGGYSLYQPTPMQEDTRRLFASILDYFLTRFEFELP